MIRNDYVSDKRDYLCLSTDEKITEGVCNGSTCWEVDTGKLYIFYLGEWYEQP